MTLRVRPRVRGLSGRITANGKKFDMGLLIIKGTCYSSLMRGAGVSTQQFSSLQENKIRFKQSMLYGGRGTALLPYMGYIGICRCEGHGFQAVYSRIGHINQNVWI